MRETMMYDEAEKSVSDGEEEKEDKEDNDEG